jgi:hypothetical protein
MGAQVDSLARAMSGYTRFGALGAVLVLAIVACSATGSELEGNSQGTGATMGFGGGVGVGGSGASSFNGEECGKATYGNEVPGSLLVVMDKSGSMSDSAGGSTKYNATAQALGAMMAAASDSTEMGLLAYPEGNFDDAALAGCLINPQGVGCAAILDDSGCTDVATAAHVPIQALSSAEPAINAYLASESPGGNTPTRHALVNGYAILAAHTGLGQRYALLMTDGEPTVHQPPFGPFPETAKNCGSQMDIETEVAGASQNGIATFVIGSPGSEGAATFLSQLAINGNTKKDPACSAAAGNCHYQIGSGNFQQELADVLQQIAGVIADCIFDIPSGEDVDPNLVNITIETANGPVEIYKDPTHQDGWDYTDSSQTKIQLYGPACALYKQQQGNVITIILGCETVLK